MKSISMMKSETNLRDRADYQCFLSEYGIPEKDVRAVTYSGDRHQRPMDDIEVRQSEIQGNGLFAKSKFKPRETIARALLDGHKTEAGRYTNHSARPNARMAVHDENNIDLVAIRSIKDEEIVTDYRETLRARGLHPDAGNGDIDSTGKEARE